MKKLISVLILIAVLFVSGCSQNNSDVSVDENNGLQITDFSSQYDMLREKDEKFDVYVEVENVGDTTAQDVTVELLGASWIDNEILKYIGDMYPPEISTAPGVSSTPGELKRVGWTLNIPDLPEGIKQPYPLKARVTYYYQTTGSVNLKAYERNEYYRLTRLGNAPPGGINVVNTKAPIKIGMEGAEYILVDKNEVEKSYSYRLYLNNVGSGVPITKIGQHGEKTDGLIAGLIKISGPGATFEDCVGDISEDGKTVTLEDVKLSKGESLRQVCNIKINPEKWSDIVEGQISISFELVYGYYTDKSLTITIVGDKDTTNNEFDNSQIEGPRKDFYVDINAENIIINEGSGDS